MDPRKVEAVREWPQPQNLKDVQSFLGFANFLAAVCGYLFQYMCTVNGTLEERTEFYVV